VPNLLSALWHTGSDGEGQRLRNRLLRTLEIFTKTKPTVPCIFFSGFLVL